MTIGNAGLPVVRRPVICVAENRAWCEPGIRMLVASLAKQSPELIVELFFPVASASFEQWAAGFPNLRLNAHVLSGPWRAWNIKPEAMLTLLHAGYNDVLWVDTDIIVTADVSRIYRGLTMDTIIVAEEALCSSHYDGDALRARAWGLKIGRKLPFQLNGGVVGFTRNHIPFIERWMEVLNSDEYLEAQKLPWDERPRHFMADQEVLTALLCSEDHSRYPLYFLLRGRAIIQYFGPAGYTTSERLYNFFRGMPFFIHSQGHKAWKPLPVAIGVKQSLTNLYQCVSPYIFASRPYAAHVEDAGWLAPQTNGARLLTALAFGSAPLGGLPIAMFNDLFRHIKWFRTGGEPRR